MNENRIDQALSALGFALKEQQDQNPLKNPLAFVATIPDRSLTGNHIKGGKILEFNSSGITDAATSEQIKITDKLTSIKSLSVDKFSGNLKTEGAISADSVSARELTVDVLIANEIRADIQFEKNTPIKFNSDAGQGLLWTGKDYTKQFVLNIKPYQFFSSESINLASEKSFKINNIDVITESELGASITKSNLKQVGRLKGLIVDGSMNINQWLVFNSESNRLGLGTENPNAAVSIVDEDVEIIIGVTDNSKGMIGTYATQGFDIVTDQTARISISPGGNIQLGNTKAPPVQVGIHGKVSIRVNNPDPDVDLHVNGAIKYCGKMQKYDGSYPTSGSYNLGDIVWNTQPRMNAHIGWVCIKPGTPGEWAPFGKIGN